MNVFKHIFIVGILTISCNACGMLGLHNQRVAKKDAQLTVLFLQNATGKDQTRAFELLGKGNMRTKEENRELAQRARSAYKSRHGLGKQEQDRAIMKNSDPRRRHSS
jgi:hypothetical protein